MHLIEPDHTSLKLNQINGAIDYHAPCRHYIFEGAVALFPLDALVEYIFRQRFKAPCSEGRRKSPNTACEKCGIHDFGV